MIVRTKLEGFPFFEDLRVEPYIVSVTLTAAFESFADWNKRTSPQPLHGYAASSCSIGDSGYAAGESMMIFLPLPQGRTPSINYIESL